jgi:hypothetical protein
VPVTGIQPPRVGAVRRLLLAMKGDDAMALGVKKFFHAIDIAWLDPGTGPG